MLEPLIKAKLIDFLIATDNTGGNTIVGSELFFADGDSRADLVTLNDTLSAYEIKSSRDDLAKLARQIKSYRACFDYVVVVTTQRHIQEVLRFLPKSVGILFCDDSENADEEFLWYRIPARRFALQKNALAQFLTRRDLIRAIEKPASTLAGLGAIQLRKFACKQFKKAELRKLAHDALRQRLLERWRIFLNHKGEVTHTDDLLLLASKPARLKPTRVSVAG